MKTICVIGTGYVGLVTGTCLAQLGNQVTCMDVVAEKIERLRAGVVPIHEPGLEPLVAANTRAGRLRFTTSYAEALAGAEFIFIAVNTPSVDGGKGADMQYVESAARAIAEYLAGNAVIINKSTMPVGSGDLVSAILREHLADPTLAVAVVANPEFLREGNAVHDFLHPDRIVLGSMDRQAAAAVAHLYLPLRAPIMLTDLYTAEMIKYASNAFLAAKISFINEMARICERLGADVNEVAEGMGYDKRIGRAFLNAGLGYGGSCFPKDVKALAHMAAETGLHPQLLEAVMSINVDQRHTAIEKLEAELGELAGKRIAVLGLAFKDDTDDMREAASIDIIRWLLDAGAEVRAHDPVATQTAQLAMPGWAVTYCADPYEAARGCDAAVVVTEWGQYRQLDLTRLREALRRPVLVDGRNLFDPEDATRLGFAYHGVGRPNGRPCGREGRSGSDRATLAAVARRALTQSKQVNG
ncbi:MAG TPA: UDP-glucose/GDP-mannose dehydrogenase family protein [Ktedonobacterales bacterium]|nr:UDP-glucose/GDP-mannose dehydrogenase family protein [Ktedonobacterales bacterium]